MAKPVVAKKNAPRSGSLRVRRPVVIVGYGALGRMEYVIKLAEKLKAPVLTTFKAKGQIADDHQHAAGVLGRSGTPVASWCMNEADILLVFGASFSNHTGMSSKKSITQADYDRGVDLRRHDVRRRESGDDLAQVAGDPVVLFGQVDLPLRYLA